MSVKFSKEFRNAEAMINRIPAANKQNLKGWKAWFTEVAQMHRENRKRSWERQAQAIVEMIDNKIGA